MTYQVPMVELRVQVALVDSEPEEYILFLAPYSDRNAGVQTVWSYLNGARFFFPMVGGGVPKIVNRAVMLWMRTDRHLSQEDLDRAGTVVQKLIIVEMTDGVRLEGFVPIDRPADQSRISDVLNDQRELFMQLDDETVTYFINKRYIRLVIPR